MRGRGLALRRRRRRLRHRAPQAAWPLEPRGDLPAGRHHHPGHVPGTPRHRLHPHAVRARRPGWRHRTGRPHHHRAPRHDRRRPPRRPGPATPRRGTAAATPPPPPPRPATGRRSRSVRCRRRPGAARHQPRTHPAVAGTGTQPWASASASWPCSRSWRSGSSRRGAPTRDAAVAAPRGVVDLGARARCRGVADEEPARAAPDRRGGLARGRVAARRRPVVEVVRLLRAHRHLGRRDPARAPGALRGAPARSRAVRAAVARAAQLDGRRERRRPGHHRGARHRPLRGPPAGRAAGVRGCGQLVGEPLPPAALPADGALRGRGGGHRRAVVRAPGEHLGAPGPGGAAAAWPAAHGRPGAARPRGARARRGARPLAVPRGLDGRPRLRPARARARGPTAPHQRGVGVGGHGHARRCLRPARRQLAGGPRPPGARRAGRSSSRARSVWAVPGRPARGTAPTRGCCPSGSRWRQAWPPTWGSPSRPDSTRPR